MIQRFLLVFMLLLSPAIVFADDAAPAVKEDYKIGVDDILTINVLQPEQIQTDVTVSPDGTITFPYVGTIHVQGETLAYVQHEIEQGLANGYLKYPSVVVYLKQSRSLKFFVYGEVIHPGPYYLENNLTVMRAISMAGGFTKFGSASRVKVLRPKKSGGYDTVPINIKAIMSGDSTADAELSSGDMVVVSEGVF